MMLFAYRQQVQRLLGDTAHTRFNLGDIDVYINTARGQLAGEGECIRVYSRLSIGAAAQQYPFSAIAFPPGTLGVAGVLNVRMMTWAVASGQKRMTSREWPWFNDYELAQPVPAAGPPRVWTQFGQGANGTLFFNLLDADYVLSVDAVCYPAPLAGDADPEAIPYLWTDAIPYYAAYMALLSVQNADGAQAMFNAYRLFAARARGAATPAVLPGSYEAGPDPMGPNRLGIHPAAQRGDATAA